MIRILVAVCGVYVYLICPKLRHRCNMKPFSEQPIAHRGIHDNKTIAENSMTAFRKAVEAGYGIELDVRFTKDRRMVVFHDDDLNRMCGDPRLVSDVTYNELKNIPLRHSGETIPTLREVLDVVNGQVPLLIEMKSGISAAMDIPIRLAQEMKHYKGIYSVESFNPLYIRKYRKLDKDIACGVLSTKFPKVKLKQKPLAIVLENLLMNFLAKPDFIAYQYTDCKKISFRLNRLLGAATVAWTIPQGKAIGERAKKSFDAFICDISDPAGMLDLPDSGTRTPVTE